MQSLTFCLFICKTLMQFDLTRKFSKNARVFSLDHELGHVFMF